MWLKEQKRKMFCKNKYSDKINANNGFFFFLKIPADKYFALKTEAI